ncbi:TROVE domain-containing protein [Actinokineospora sp. 24-640]
MARFNIAAIKAAVFSPVVTEAVPSGLTHEGGSGHARDTRSELFLLAVANMVGENTFYESADKRDTRYAELVARAAVEHPDWTARFLRWLRTDGNMRTASIVGAAEYVRARLAVAGTRPARRHETADAAGQFEGDNLSYSTISNRAVIDSVLQRADEPGELLAYWTSVHGRNVPKPVKRGVADAVARLYDERSLLKWDSDSRGWRMGDVVDFVHPSPRAEWQGDLFAHALDRRHGRDNPIPASLATLAARAELMAWPVEKRRELFARPELETAVSLLRQAGMTWEALAGWLQGPLTARAWEAMIPSMGYMALLRNLRNFDQAGVSDEVAEQVCARLADPAQVAKSRQLPMRFLSAHKAAPSLRWGYALDKALTASLATVPALAGRTLVLIDTSGSMNAGFSKNGTLMRWDAAVVFGLAVAARCAHADVVSFSNGYGGAAATKVFPLRKGESLLRSVDRWQSDGYFIGGGTDTPGAIRAHLRPRFHDRLLILTDEQTTGHVNSAVPATMPLYTWNLAGYRMGHTPSGVANRHTFGGLTDAAFRMVPLLEAGRNADWPF